MNRESELSKFKLHYEDLQERSYWRELIKRAAHQVIREHIQKPLATVALTMPARVRRRRR
ncbi:hypothetical protein RhoFasB10_03307 [Rhodococcus sp. B10]|nr:hypothetical protein [Rhodococcus sp. B10]